MSLLDEVGEELKEEGYDEQPYMHAVDISIGGHYNLVVAQRVEAVLYVERSLQEVELLVFINHLLGKSERVEGFSA